ncbi:MAG: DUF58 domain-containing protein [Gammaproteobacteria bacterium]|nr:DUF58 domain-containing protein [Gammaproteobacteria bacterium]MBU0772084.1 DUF58 domain-containing protein [Gammaproteobacteria bacterium]MBU1848779.1 DUF58 domain-containing protein [Gammaproteobacteria bacterium]
MRESIRRWLSSLGGPSATPLTLDRRRIFVLPTAAGAAFGCALIAMLLTAINYTLSLGFALVFLLAGLGQVTLLHTFRNLLALRVRCGTPEPVFAGQPARFPLWLDNDTARTRPALLLSMPGAGDSTVTVEAGQHARIMLALPTTQRGWLRPSRVTLSTRYPLGLIRAWSYAQPDQRCLVHARPETGRPPLPQTGGGQAGARRAHDGGEEFARLRTHRAADSPRHVAWKAWARSPDSPLLTKQFEGNEAGELWLDFAQLPDALSLEHKLSRLTGWALDAEAAGLRYGLVLPGTRLPPASGATHRAHVLRAIALHGLAS